MADKTYINGISVKEKSGEYGTFFAVSFSEKFIAEYEKYKNEKGYLNVNISKRKETGKYGETHSVLLNTYVKNSKPETETNYEESKPDDNDNLPF